MKIAVLGGNGYLGHHVTKYFNATPLSRRTGFDITKPKDCEQLKDYDVVIHMAALVDKTNERLDEVFRVNVYGTLNVVKALGKGQTLIFTSTKDVYGEGTHYATTKACADICVNHYAEKNNFRAGIFRLSTTYAPPTNGGNFVNVFVWGIQGGTEISLFMNGMQTRDFLYIDDLSGAFENFIYDSTVSNEFYNIGGGEKNSTTLLGLVKIIEKIVGKKAKISFSEEEPRGQINYITDLTKVEQGLDWLPTTSIKQGIKRIIQ